MLCPRYGELAPSNRAVLVLLLSGVEGVAGWFQPRPDERTAGWVVRWPRSLLDSNRGERERQSERIRRERGSDLLRRLRLYLLTVLDICCFKLFVTPLFLPVHQSAHVSPTSLPLSLGERAFVPSSPHPFFHQSCAVYLGTCAGEARMRRGVYRPCFVIYSRTRCCCFRLVLSSLTFLTAPCTSVRV